MLNKMPNSRFHLPRLFSKMLITVMMSGRDRQVVRMPASLRSMLTILTKCWAHRLSLHPLLYLIALFQAGPGPATTLS